MDDQFDVVIVGAGIAGAIIAKQLAAQRKRVLILEAGRGYHLEGNAAYRDYQSFLQTYYTNTIKAPNSPYPPNANAPQQDCVDAVKLNGRPDTTGYFVQMGPLPFSSDYVRTQGGTTLHWLGCCPRMLPNDFRLQSQYGQGADWPISYQDLLPWYEQAEREIGVSGDVEATKIPGMGRKYFSDKYVYPMEKVPQSYVDQQVSKFIGKVAVEDAGDTYRLSLVPTPQGRNSTPNPKYKDFSGEYYAPVGSLWDPAIGQRCEGNSACVPICPVQAKYNALKTLAAAVRAHPGRVEIRAQSVASQIEFDVSGRVTGIVYKHYWDPKSPEHVVRKAHGKMYVIAAHSVETAKLLLASGAEKNNPNLGANLMDHATMLTWGLMPEPVGAFRGPGATSNIPTFRDGRFRSKHAAFIVPIDNWGWAWSGFDPGVSLGEMVKTTMGRSLRSQLGSKLSRQVTLQFEFEQPPQSINRITIDPQYKDALGNFRPVVTWGVPDYTQAAMPVAAKIWKAFRAQAGIPDSDDATKYDPSDPTYLKYQGIGYSFRGAGHLVGTHCMGTSKKNSVVNKRQRTWDHDNLYLAGCGNMTTIGTSNPTLTMSALSFWAAKNILEDLDR